MNRYLVSTVGVAAVALALSLATPGVSDAYSPDVFVGYGYYWGGYPRWYGVGYGPGYRLYSGPYYRSTYPVTYVFPRNGYIVTKPVPPTNTASIRVAVPESAKVWFGDHQTTQTGPERLFESPPLTPGTAYSYDIKAQWRDQDGKEVTQTRHVDVAANGKVNVSFGPPAAE